MPKAILEFNLPEEQSEFELACSASKYYSVIFDLDQDLRAIVKYDNGNLSDKEYKIYENIREKLWNLLTDEGISNEFYSIYICEHNQKNQK